MDICRSNVFLPSNNINDGISKGDIDIKTDKISMLIILGAEEKRQRKIFCHLYLRLCSKTWFSVFSVENSSSSIILRKIMNDWCAVQNVKKKKRKKFTLSSKMKKSLEHGLPIYKMS